jgi:hypothetical protein
MAWFQGGPLRVASGITVAVAGFASSKSSNTLARARSPASMATFAAARIAASASAVVAPPEVSAEAETPRCIELCCVARCPSFWRPFATFGTDVPGGSIPGASTKFLGKTRIFFRRP